MRKSILAAIAGLMLGTTAVAQTSEQTLSPLQAQELGLSLLNQGDAIGAANVANALLVRNPNDVSALVVAAESAIRTDRFQDALGFARRAFRATARADSKYTAARLIASAHAGLRQDTRAQIWLRRARQYAPTPQAAQSVAKEFQFLRNRNPWSTSLEFGITPSTNINNGAIDENINRGFVLSADGVALSGIKINAGLRTSYRLRQSARSVTFFTADANITTYALSDESKKSDPTLKGSDFEYTTTAVGLRHRQIFSEGALPTDFSIRFGRQTYAGEPYVKTKEFTASHSWSLGENTRLTPFITAVDQRGYNDRADVRIYTVGANLRHGFANGDQLSFGATKRESRSTFSGSDYDGKSFTIGYDFGQSFQGMSFGFGASLEERDYPSDILVQGARRDKIIGLDMSVTFENLEFYGFRPVINVNSRRSRSNSDRFDTDTFGLGFDLRSSF